MATAESNLFTKLSTTTGVSTLVGRRVYPQEVPADVAGSVPTPYVCYECVKEAPLLIATGTSNTTRLEIAVACVARTYASARSLRSAIRAAVAGWRDQTLTPAVDSCQATDAADAFFIPQDASQRGLNVVNLTLVLWVHTG